MPIKLVIHKEVILGDAWVDKEGWDMLQSGRLDWTFLDVLNEGPLAVIDACGGLEGLIQSMEWVREHTS